MVLFLRTLTERFSSKLSSSWPRLYRKSTANLQQYETQQNSRQASTAARNVLQDIIFNRLLGRTWNPVFHTVFQQKPSGKASFHCYSGDRVLDAQISNWMDWDQSPHTKAQIIDAIKQEDWETLQACMNNRMVFGTDGFRAPMRAGFDGMNELVVIQTAQGLCAYLKQEYPDESMWSERGVVIGYDARYNSKLFAELCSIVFLNNNFRVHLFGNYVSTPFVPFTIFELDCLAGIMVTGCHHPKNINGLKIYWSNGAPVTSPHDAAIQRCILQNLEPAEDSWNQEVLSANELLSNPYKQIVEAYYESLKSQLSTFLEDWEKYPLNIIYTAMHGVGYPYIELAFKAIEFDPVIPVLEQVSPNPDFPDTPIPDDALYLATRRATIKNADLILINDPVAGCMAAAEVVKRKYRVFSSNELGALLGWWAWENYVMSEEDPDASNCVMIASTLSSKILKSMAEVEGFAFHETLSGFKWIGNKVLEEEDEGRNVLFAFDEAFGYMLSTNVLDKDGISAAAHLASMASYLRSEKDMKLQDKLDEIYDNYGYHVSQVSYHVFDNERIIKNIFNRLRTFDDGRKDTYPTSILNGEYAIESVRDLTTGYDSSTDDEKATLPSSKTNQMITFNFSNGFVITLQASRAQPKITYYAEMCGEPENKSWTALNNKLKEMVEAIVREFYEPEKNGLKSTKGKEEELRRVCMYAL
ncbi:uncharacterized protein Dmoj_GI21115 [Drosophila mojavensis]|uniref:Uncharacterized protein n=1 Tax=Drosophila mojavensis TaxID=7230 RepID=B4KS47_DROMO|nr:uncharacterized protein Dmoj_GI21115 [Drosophila mojavensis]